MVWYGTKEKERCKQNELPKFMKLMRLRRHRAIIIAAFVCRDVPMSVAQVGVCVRVFVHVQQLCILACGVDASLPQALSKSITNVKVLRDRSLIDFLMFVCTENRNREQMHCVWPSQQNLWLWPKQQMRSFNIVLVNLPSYHMHWKLNERHKTIIGCGPWPKMVRTNHRSARMIVNCER